jgi:hypothetical protein
VEYYNRLAIAGLPFVQLDGASGIGHDEPATGGATMRAWKYDRVQVQLRRAMHEVHKRYFMAKSTMLHGSDMLEHEIQQRRLRLYFHTSLDGFPTFPLSVQARNVTWAVGRALAHVAAQLDVAQSCLGISAITMYSGNCSIEFQVVVRF